MAAMHRSWPNGKEPGPWDMALETSVRSNRSAAGRVYELEDFESPSAETLSRLRAIIDEAFGRKASPGPGGHS